MSSFASMQGLLELLVHWLSSLVKSRRRLEAENLVLRHQVRRSHGAALADGLRKAGMTEEEVILIGGW